MVGNLITHAIHRIRVLFLAFLLLAPDTLQAEKLRVYFIGNSLTMSTTLDRVHQLVGQQGVALEFGSQLSGGKSLIRHMHYRAEPEQKWISWETNVRTGEEWKPDANPYVQAPGEIQRFGLHDEALPNHGWDKVVMQLFAGTLQSDLEAVSSFIELAESSGHPPQSYLIYSTWPHRPPAKSETKAKKLKDFALIDYAEIWKGEYTATADETDSKVARLNYSTRSYVQKLHAALRERYPLLDVRVLPVGEIFYVLDQKIRRDELPGLRELVAREPGLLPGLVGDFSPEQGINLLYADVIHLNPVPHRSNSLGIFVSGTSLTAALTGKSPVGLSAEIYGLDDPADRPLIEAIQQTIWEVLQNDPRSGL